MTTIKINVTGTQETINSTNEWLSTASPEEIGLAISIGRYSVRVVNDIVNSKLTESFVQLSSLRSNIGSEITPVSKGQQGEDFIENILREKFNVTNVTKNGKSGDLSLLIEHRKISVEVKNYINPVPTSQIDKFRRDLITTGSSAGIFISLKSAITGVTADFTIRYENTDGRIIPCAYIVSCESSVIITAVNMISQLLSSFEYISAELHSKDKILNGIYNIGNRLSDLSRVRNDLQCEVGNLSNKLLTHSCGIFEIESDLKKEIKIICGELFHDISPNVNEALIELNTIPNFVKCSADIKSCISNLMLCVQETLHVADINGSIWKLSAKKCINSITQISLIFLSGKIQVSIPRCRVNNENICILLNTLGGKISISDSILIDIDSSTIDVILKIIKGCQFS
jgi:hypothetical protein